MKITFTSLFFFICILTSNAQEFKVITGQLIDKETGAGVPYANIGIPERGIGTTSNDDGRFTFKVPLYYINSTLIVSVIGYETFKRPVKDFDSAVIIDLNPTSYSLSEVQITDESGVENIIRKAVARIPKNYATYPTNVLGFYRESRTDKSDQYVYLAEGVLNIFKTSYKNEKPGMVGLVQGRKINLKNPLDTIIKGGFSSGHMAAHRFDFVKNREDFINEDYFPAYRYWIESITSYDGREVYVIGFDKDPDAKNLNKKRGKDKAIWERILGLGQDEKYDAYLRGKVLIEKETYAFIRAEFEVTEQGLRRYEDYPLYSGNWTFNTYVVNYRELDGKWYFNDALREGGRESGGIYSNEIKITEIDTKRGKPIPFLERLDRGEEFVDMTGVYDENFWQSYNIVPMSEKLSESMQQFQTAQKAATVFAPKEMARLQELRDSVEIAERIAKAQEEAMKKEEPFDPGSITIGEPGIQKKRNRKVRMQTMLGLGTQLIKTPKTNMAISYLDAMSNERLLHTSGTISPQDFEIIYSSDLNITMNNRWFLRFSGARDFGSAIFRESASGLGAQFNFSRGRPVFLRISAQHSRSRYARLLGTVDNSPEGVRIDNKTFNRNRVRMYYGSRTLQLKLNGELSIALSRHREFYLRGSYYLPYRQNQEAHFREASWPFRKRERLPVNSDRITVTRDGEPFSGSLIQDGVFQITCGFLWK